MAWLTCGLAEPTRHVTGRPLSLPAHRHVCVTFPLGPLIEGVEDGPKRLGGDFSALGKDGAPLYRLVAAGASRKARCRLAFAGQVSTGMPLAIADERDHGGPFPTRANHPKGWDAKPLAYVQRALDMAAGLPGEHSTSIGLCMSRGLSELLSRRCWMVSGLSLFSSCKPLVCSFFPLALQCSYRARRRSAAHIQRTCSRDTTWRV